MPGGLMVGRIGWAVIGVILLAAGVALLVWARRRWLLREARRRFSKFLA